MLVSVCFRRMLSGILAGSDPKMLAEDGGEMRLTVETAVISDLCDIDFSLLNQLCRPLHSDVADKLGSGDACQLLHFAVELRTADAYVGGERLHTVFRISEVVIDRLHDTVHELLIVACGRCAFDILDLVTCSRVFAFEPSDVVDEIVNDSMELFHAERLLHIGVDAEEIPCRRSTVSPLEVSITTGTSLI